MSTGAQLLAVTPPVVLTIAGSDSGGGAGIAADLRTFAALGVFGTLAVTAITAQDTEKLHTVVPVDPDLLDAQIDAVLGDFHVAVAKTGMLATPELIERVIQRAAERRLPPLVVDPVMATDNGAALFEGDAAEAYRRLLPYAAVVTPNLHEAAELTGRPVGIISDMRDAARALLDMGARAVIVKGGHLRGPRVIDVVAGDGELLELGFPKVSTRNHHGSGCTLSAAITANLALGMRPLEAIRGARSFVTDAIVRSASLALGAGSGPIDHLGTLTDTRRY